MATFSCRRVISIGWWSESNSFNVSMLSKLRKFLIIARSTVEGRELLYGNRVWFSGAFIAHCLFLAKFLIILPFLFAL